MNKRRTNVQSIKPSKKRRTKGVKVARRKEPVIKFRQSLFWDVDPKKIDPQKHATYIIERILDFGNDQELRWMAHYYRTPQIHKVVTTSRAIHNKSKSLWQLVFR